MRTITMFDGADNAITFDIPDDFRYVEASSDLAGDYPAVWYRDVEFVPYINSDSSGGKFTLGEAGANIVFSAIHDGDETANFTNLDELRDWAESFPYDPRDPDRERDAEANGDYEDTMTDAEADADTLRSAGMGTDEDYGYYGGNDDDY